MLTNTPDILTTQDLMQLLHISKTTALKLIHENIITGHWNGNRWLILKEDVLDYILHT